MKLYSYYTPSHRDIKDNWFLPSFKDDFKLIIEEHAQECPAGKYMQEGWINCMMTKVDLIIRAVQENYGKVFIHSDVDIQFFKPVIPIIEKLIKGKDMVIQKESPRGTVCPGFFAAVGNKMNLKLWQDIKRELENQTEKHDQDMLNNKLLRNAISFIQKCALKVNPSDKSKCPNAYDLKWNYLPDTFYSPGIRTGKIWNPGEELQMPKNIILHHASWTVGTDNKIAQLNYVRDIVHANN